MEFARHFLPVATWLVKQNRISQMDLDKKFWQGLSTKVQDGISLQLRFNDPKNYDPTQYPDFDKTVKAGRVALSGDRIDVIRSNPMCHGSTGSPSALSEEGSKRGCDGSRGGKGSS